VSLTAACFKRPWATHCSTSKYKYSSYYTPLLPLARRSRDDCRPNITVYIYSVKVVATGKGRYCE